MMESFLMSTVALGGAVNVMPLLFSRVPLEATEVKKFRMAIVSGLCVCGAAIATFTFFVMKAVPQFPSAEDPERMSLQKAGEEGCLSTIALADTMQTVSGGEGIIQPMSQVIDFFIMISVTVSYITVATGLKVF
jgi:hypothetical protein